MLLQQHVLNFMEHFILVLYLMQLTNHAQGKQQFSNAENYYVPMHQIIIQPILNVINLNLVAQLLGSDALIIVDAQELKLREFVI